MSQTTISTIQGRQEEIGGGCACILLPAAIAAVVIASQYDADASPCGGSTFTIDLQLFLYIVGYIQIGYCALHLCIACCSNSCSEENKASLLRLVRAPDCLLLCFYLSFAGIGLYMYCNQMSEGGCKQEPIAMMILAWSIIQYALIGLAFCCILCMFCFMGAIFGAVAAAKAVGDEMSDDRDQEALMSDDKI
eukprot:UN01873